MITLAVAPLTTTFLIAIRLGTVLLLSPIEAIRLLPIPTRIILLLLLSMLIVANVSAAQDNNTTEFSLVLSSLAEFFNGLFITLSLSAAFAIFQIAGQLIDTQIGFNSLAILNPTNQAYEPLSGRLLMMLAVLFFFTLDEHHQLIQGLSLSFKIIEPGQFGLFNGFAPVIQLCSLMFSLALMLASPIIISLIIVDISGAILTRNMPQISIYFLTLPIKILLGLFIFMFLLNNLNPLIQKAFNAYFQTLNQMLS